MSFFEKARTKAIQQVDECFPLATRLDDSEVSNIKQDFFTGWSFPTPNDVINTFWLLIDSEFPYSLPKVIINGNPIVMSWPHVESNGRLCLAGDNATVSTTDPLATIEHVLNEAKTLIAENCNGLNTEDFKDDFIAYWHRSFEPSTPSIRVLIDSDGPNRIVSAWHGKDHYLVAESEEKVVNWLDNLYGENPARKTNKAAVIYLDGFPEISEYPNNARDLRKIIKQLSTEGLSIFDKIIASEPYRAVIILVCRVKHGTNKLFGVELQKPKKSTLGKRTGATPYLKGFRQGKVPATVISNHYLIRKVIVRDVDSSRTRLPKEQTKALNKKSIVVIGCGSLGSTVSVRLAQSGVRNIHLIDNENLGWENIGRHELGADSVSKNKANSLALHIRKRIPQVNSVTSTPDSLIKAYLKNKHTFDGADLIVSLTGDWNSESALSDLMLSGEITCPVLYGWMEPRAAAAHAVLINDNRSCFRCGFDLTGSFKIPATIWHKYEGQTECGGATSIYGINELSQASSLISNLVFYCLEKKPNIPIWRTWLAPKIDVYNQGGIWNPDWRKQYGDQSNGGYLTANPWPKQAICNCNGG